MIQKMSLKVPIQVIKYSSVFLRSGVLVGAAALLAFPPCVRAVMPAPDGGYENFNTAEGAYALFSLHVFEAGGNTALGDAAL